MRPAIVLVALAAPVAAEPMPSGTIGVVFGATSGTGADAKEIGAGVNYFGLQAMWHPITTERRWGFSARWATMFGLLWGGKAAQIESPLRTVQMDLLVGLRFRPWKSPSRYLTLRVGGELLRANEPIPPAMERSFVGAIASVGYDQYLSGMMLNIDVRYGLIAFEGPRSITLMVGAGFTGP